MSIVYLTISQFLCYNIKKWITLTFSMVMFKVCLYNIPRCRKALSNNTAPNYTIMSINHEYLKKQAGKLKYTPCVPTMVKCKVCDTYEKDYLIYKGLCDKHAKVLLAKEYEELTKEQRIPNFTNTITI